MMAKLPNSGASFKFLFLRKPFMLGKIGIKVLDHFFLHKFTLKFLGDHSLTPCRYGGYKIGI
jgi:hypothetical protein